MRRACSNDRRRGFCGAAALAVLGGGLAACSMSGTTSPSPSLTSFTSMFSGSSAQPAAAAGPTFDEADCPPVQVRFGASTISVAANVAQPTASDLRYQLSFNRFARQCALSGTDVTMRIGVEGRVVVGPAGAPEQVEVPLRYAVVQEGVNSRMITTKFKRFAVALAPGEGNITFTDIEEGLSFPLPKQDALDSYVVYVGFDEVGDGPPKRPPPKAAKKGPRPKLAPQ